MKVKRLLTQIIPSSAFIVHVSCSQSSAISIPSPSSNAHIVTGSTATLTWQNNEDVSAIVDASLQSSNQQIHSRSLKLSSGTGSVSVQVPRLMMQGTNKYVIKLINGEIVSLATTGTLFLVDKEDMTRISSSTKVTQRTFVTPSLPYTPEAIDDSSLPLSQQPYTTKIMSEKNVVATLTLTSVQVAGIAMGIVACSSFVLAVFIWCRFLLQKRRERLLDNADEESVNPQPQQQRPLPFTHDYSVSTIHDTQLQHLGGSSSQQNYNAYFVHNGLPIPPSQAIYKTKS